MKFTCLKQSFPLFWRSWEASSLTQAGCSVLNSRRRHNEDTSSAILKYYMQDITVNNYHFISLKIIITLFPLGNYIQFNREQ